MPNDLQSCVRVLNVNIYNRNIPAAVNACITACLGEPEGNRCISATGAHGLVYAQQNPAFFRTLGAFAVNLPDGMPTVWVGRLKGARYMERCYGPDFFKALITQSAGTPIKHFFCGGKEGVADELALVCRTKYNNANICGTFCPPFRPMTEDELQALGREIDASGAHVVWIGLSTPKQEVFAHRLSRYIHVHFLITVGAAFDFHTGKVKQAPAFVQQMGLEWLYRLMREPRRLYKRYLEIVPLFIYYNARELFLRKTPK